MARKVLLANMRGGSGKSTLAVQLAWHFALMSGWNKKVLVVDVDPQANLSQYLLGAEEYNLILKHNLPTTWTIFEESTHLPTAGKPLLLYPGKAIYHFKEFPGGGRIDLIPSRLELAFSIRNPGQKALLLTKLIAKIEERYDLILLDSGPNESFLTMAAFLASDAVIIPVRPGPMASLGLPLLVNALEFFRKHYVGHELTIGGILFNAVSGSEPKEARFKEEVKAIAEKNEWHLFKNEVGHSPVYARDIFEGKPIIRESYPEWAQADRFKKFSAEFAERVEL